MGSAPIGQQGETWCCLLPLCQAQILPAQAGVLRWPSLTTAMGPRGVRGKKGLLGPWSTALAACHGLARGAQHHTALVPLV